MRLHIRTATQSIRYDYVPFTFLPTFTINNEANKLIGTMKRI